MLINKVDLATKNNLEKTEDSTVIYYDDDCGLCRKVKDWIISQDNKKKFLYKNLRELPHAFYHENRKLDSIIVQEKNNFYIKSNAVIKVLLGLEKRIPAFFLAIIPLPLRDRVYDLIAKYRGFFFRSGDCSLPDKVNNQGKR